jgi:DNA-binding NarL/FixJ family response regulator
LHEADDVNQSLVGRDREVATLIERLDEVRAGESRFAVISGEPGIGKTRLLDELVDTAEAQDCLALQGSAAEFEQELPFGLLVDAFDAYLEALDLHAFERLATDRLGELAAVFPSLRDLGAAIEQPTTAAERFRVHNAIRELIERLATRKPLLLTLDDLHWADGASLELITHLLRRPAQAPVMVVVTFRTGQVDSAVVKAIEAADQGVERLELGPLDSAEAATLIERVEAADGDRLLHESGGNPFYLLELARANGSSNAQAAAPLDDSASVPAAVAAAIAAEVDGLSPTGRTLAEAAAVSGDPFELDIAALAAPLADAEALDAVDELVAQGLVHPAEVPRRFRFRHPLVRAAVYADCAPGMRLQAHERIASALAARGAPARARAHHVEQAARHGDTHAVEVLREAGLETAQQAPSSAVRWFAAALRLLPADAPVELRLDLLGSLAGAQVATGDFESARSALLESIELFAKGEAMLRVRLTTACAAIEQLLGRHEMANVRLLDALEQVDDAASAEGVALLIALSANGQYRGDPEAMHEWAVKAADAAARSGDPSLRPAAIAALAQGAAFAGKIEKAQQCCDEATVLVDALSDDELAQQLTTMGNLAGAELYLDRYEQAVVHSQRGLALARATSQGEMVPMLNQSFGASAYMLGRTREAIEAIDGAVEAARLSRNPHYLSWMLMNRSNYATLSGDLETALATGEESVAVSRQFDTGAISAWSAAILGAGLLQAGDPERAVGLILERSGGEEMTGIPGAWRAWGLEVLTRCWLELDREEEAVRAAESSARVAEATNLPLAHLMADRAAAAVRLAAGDAPAAAERALAAASSADEIGALVDGAAARELAGRSLAAAGDAEGAIRELEHAARDFEACGAVRYRNQAEQELRKLGRRIHRRTRPGKPDGSTVESLTERELEVASLVVDRRSNREIASELFLSLKTVETHMRNIFRKLDVSSRADAARAVERARDAS